MDSIKILISIVGNFVELFLGIFFFIVIRIFFNITIVGYYGAITSFFLIFKFIVDFGVSIAYLKYFSESKNIEEQAICNGTLLFFKLIQFFIFFIVILIFFFFSVYPDYEGNSLVFFIFFLGSSLHFFNTHVLTPILFSKKEVTKNYSAINIFLLIRLIYIVVIVLFFEFDINLFASTFVISNFVLLLIDLYLLRKTKVKKATLEYKKKFFSFIKPYFVLSSLVLIINNIDTILITFWFSLEEVANYYTAKQIYIYFVTFIPVITTVLLTTFSKNISEGKNKINLLVINEVHKFSNLFIVPLGFLSLLFSTQLLVFIFGEGYRLTGVIFTIFSFSLTLTSIGFAIDIQLRALGDIKFLVKKQVIMISISLITMIFFISPLFLNLGAIGGAFASVLSQFLGIIIYRPIIFKKYRIGFYWEIFRNLGIMIVIYFLQITLNLIWLPNIYSIILFIIFDYVIYLTLNYILKGFTKKDIKFLLTVFNFKNIKDNIVSELKGEENL